MKNQVLFLIVACVLLITTKSFGQNKSEKFEIKSNEVKGQTYSIEVVLPDTYDATKKYPIIYFTDWWFASRIVPGLYSVISHSIEPVILVGIMDKSSVDLKTWSENRSRDLSPTNLPSKDSILQVPKGTTGGAKQYLSFMKNELIPTVEEKYQSNAEKRGYCGYSYGGLFGMYILVNEPNLFKKYLIGGATLWWDDYLILNEIEKMEPENLASVKSIFLSVGENDGMLFLKDFAIIKEQLSLKKPLEMELETTIILDDDHMSAIPATIVKGLKFLYGL